MSLAQIEKAEDRDLVAVAFGVAFWTFVGTIAFSIAGSLLLKLVPAAMDVFGPYYVQLVQAPTWTYMALLPLLPMLMYGPTVGWRRMAFFFAWGSALGGASELIGTTTGFPFGVYEYGFWLGPKLFDHVPYFIPPSWFAMSIISLDLARRLATSRLGRILLATVFMVLWDVSLDPAMSRAFPFWTYAADGFYYGMPLSNWAGWFGVTLVIVAGYEWMGGGLAASHRWAPWLYALNCIFPLSICLLQGLYGAAAIGAVATAVPLALVYYRGRPADIPSPA